MSDKELLFGINLLKTRGTRAHFSPISISGLFYPTWLHVCRAPSAPVITLNYSLEFSSSLLSILREIFLNVLLFFSDNVVHCMYLLFPQLMKLLLQMMEPMELFLLRI
jgi:hypothetical protein